MGFEQSGKEIVKVGILLLIVIGVGLFFLDKYGLVDVDGLITRVDDLFAGVILDSPDTKIKNVTIEGK
ncbi:hypothetical protein ACQRXC_29260 (plasmid) [Niallia taxi]|uniref:hypothetical protein n=1 Tax=Niallia taxi TaxID=2499688 RepID=UPI003F6316D3